ncbi:MAG TPA: alpha/beta fold hydrolase [Candidatus Eisenbacteria bacterium]|nr:alpha/beta fold hydrolase [Candidatus Eisenbacteria bacterium]
MQHGFEWKNALIAATVAIVAVAVAPAADAKPAAPGGPGKTFRAAGATIWFEIRGATAGRPLVMVNGGPGFAHDYVLCSDAWDALAKRRRVVFYDQRGTGRSGALAKDQTCTLADQIADLEALRQELRADKIDLIGHSWGGYLVMAYAVRHPDRVARLIIADSASPKWTDTDFIFKYVFPEGTDRQGALDFADALGDSASGAASMREYFGMLFVSTAKRDEFIANSSRYPYAKSVNEILNGELSRLDMWPVIPSLTIPTLVLTGRYDINVAPSTAWKIHKAIPGSTWAVFEKSGHLPYFEEPEQFVRVVEGFLGTP